MTKTAVYSDKAPKPRPINNQAIVANGFVFCSGQLPKDINGQLFGGTVQDRTVRHFPFILSCTTLLQPKPNADVLTLASMHPQSASPPRSRRILARRRRRGQRILVRHERFCADERGLWRILGQGQTVENVCFCPICLISGLAANVL
jgi:hypothetical protein